MKKFSMILSLVMALCLLTGCAGTTVVYYGECTCPTGSHETVAPVTEPAEETTEAAVAEGSVKTGLALIVTVDDSKHAQEAADGEAAYDVTVVAVNVDDNGVITDCIIDSIGTSVYFDTTGAITTDLTAEILTKNELGDNYNMKLYGGAAYEWYEQAAALAEYAVGKTMDELRNGAVDESGKAADADLASTATIYLAGYVDAIEVAVNNAQHLGAQAGDALKLAIISSAADSTSAEAEKDGNAQLNVDAVALTMNGETITSCMIDSVQAKIAFDTTGTISTDVVGVVPTKNQLGENYGMKAWGGAVYEWNEQAANFAAYVTGKTAAEVAGIAVTETTAPAEADLAATVTIAIGGFQALIAKACR